MVSDKKAKVSRIDKDAEAIRYTKRYFSRTEINESRNVVINETNKRTKKKV